MWQIARYTMNGIFIFLMTSKIGDCTIDGDNSLPQFLWASPEVSLSHAYWLTAFNWGRLSPSGQPEMEIIYFHCWKVSSSHNCFWYHEHTSRKHHPSQDQGFLVSINTLVQRPIHRIQLCNFNEYSIDISLACCSQLTTVSAVPHSDALIWL